MIIYEYSNNDYTSYIIGCITYMIRKNNTINLGVYPENHKFNLKSYTKIYDSDVKYFIKNLFEKNIEIYEWES